MSDEQDMLDRRVYVVTPKKALLEKVSPLVDERDLQELSKPHVVMTDELRFEEFIEGWRRSILEKCKEAFLLDEFEYGPLFELEDLDDALGQTVDLLKCFDDWWVAEEAGYTQIETDWQTENA